MAERSDEPAGPQRPPGGTERRWPGQAGVPVLTGEAACCRRNRSAAAQPRPQDLLGSPSAGEAERWIGDDSVDRARLEIREHLLGVTMEEVDSGHAPYKAAAASS